MLLVPAAPLALWICGVGPLTRFSGVRAIVVQAACVAVPLVIIAAMLQASTSGSADGW
jgi:hypothetical protein